MKKRILLVTNGFPFGESERSFLGTEVQQLAQQFHLDVLAPQNSDELLYSTEELQRIERFKNSSIRTGGLIHMLHCMMAPTVLKEFLYRAKSHAFRNIFADYKATVFTYYYACEIASKIIAMMEEAPIDIIYTYWCQPYTIGALLVKQKYPQVKVVTRFHGYDLYKERTASGWQPFRMLISEKCDQLVFACETGRDYYLAHWGAKWADKSVVSYLGCASMTHISNRESERITLVSCSNAIPLKRIHLIIEALSLLPEHILIDWHHLGDGTELGALKQQATAQLSSCANVTWKFWGHVPNCQLDALYQQIQPQLFITTSSTEGVPVSIQEAFSAGIPAIATAVGGIPELVIDGHTGYLLPENLNASQVCEAITAFCELSLEEKQKMSEHARELWREKCDAKENARCFVQILKDLCP